MSRRLVLSRLCCCNSSRQAANFFGSAPCFVCCCACVSQLSCVSLRWLSLWGCGVGVFQAVLRAVVGRGMRSALHMGVTTKGLGRFPPHLPVFSAVLWAVSARLVARLACVVPTLCTPLLLLTRPGMWLAVVGVMRIKSWRPHARSVLCRMGLSTADVPLPA